MADSISAKDGRERAQENLLSAMQAAFDRLSDDELPRDEDTQIRNEMSKQMARVEKLFGYEPGAFTRGV